MPAQYLSPEWLAEGRARIEKSAEFKDAAKTLELSMINVITDVPKKGTVYVRYAFSLGSIQDLQLGTDPAIAANEADFKVTGSYETFAALTQGKLSIAQAFLARKIKLEGSVTRAIMFVKPLDTMNRILRQVPTVY
ncbi:MAG TPA: SCP2 sterol-binding domain-containing protein [Candidatus Thermoplasmatota archaeon]